MWEDIKRYFFKNDVVTRLILVNVGAFLVFNVLFALIFKLFKAESAFYLLHENLAIPADISKFIFKPWTLITYMFMHGGIGHLLFNMLALYFMGRFFVSMLGSKKFISLYFIGGICGGLLYLLLYNLPGTVLNDYAPFSLMVGASGAVYAIMVATAAYAPNIEVSLLFLPMFRIKLVWITVVFVLLNLIQLADSIDNPASNAGGMLAHLGGAIFGYAAATNWRKGKNITAWFERMFMEGKVKWPFKKRSKLKVKYKRSKGKTSTRRPKSDEEFNAEKIARQKKIDAILDKISKSGYESLSKEEKDILFRDSKNI